MKQVKSKDTAVLEAIERDLVAKQQAFLLEKQQQVQHKTDEQQQQIGSWQQVVATTCALPYLSFVSDLHKQDE